VLKHQNNIVNGPFHKVNGYPGPAKNNNFNILTNILAKSLQ